MIEKNYVGILLDRSRFHTLFDDGGYASQYRRRQSRVVEYRGSLSRAEEYGVHEMNREPPSLAGRGHVQLKLVADRKIELALERMKNQIDFVDERDTFLKVGEYSLQILHVFLELLAISAEAFSLGDIS